MTRPTAALTRTISPSYAHAITAAPPDPPIDVTRARAQHAAYVDALRSLGLAVETLVADAAHPDGCFVEDTALVAGGVALVARSGAPARRGEVDAVIPWLAGHTTRVESMDAPATLDGGDCLRAGTKIFIGRSPRTNDAGIARAREVFAPLGFDVVAVPTPHGVLHLKCVCSPLGDGRVLLAAGTISPATFAGSSVVTIPAEEAYAANCLAVGDTALVSAGFPATHAALRAAGIRTIPLDTSEIRKADGALTCLSILV